MAGYEERGVRARVAAHCAQLAGYRRSLYDTESMRYGTYTIWNLYTMRNLYGYAAMQRATQDSYATLCRARCAMAVISTPHAVPLRSQATYNTSHLQLQTSALVLQEPIRSAARGAARASRRALGGVHGRLGIPVGVVLKLEREALAMACALQ